MIKTYLMLLLLGKLFLPDDFMRSETPFFHYEMADFIDNRECKQLAVIIPRGHGKTVLTKASIIKDFVFCNEPENFLFYAWVSATQKLSVGNMDYIKHHLEFNDRIKYYFGNLKGKKWTEEDIELTNGCKLISKSNVAGIRGGAKLHKRYDLMLQLLFILLSSLILVGFVLMVLLFIMIHSLIIYLQVMLKQLKIKKILHGK